MGSDGVIKLWDLASSSCVASMQAHRLAGAFMTWSYDGIYIATASSDREIKIWDPEKEQCLLTLLGHEGPVKAVFWSQDSTQLVSVSWSLDDGGFSKFSPLAIKVWDRTAGQCILTLEGDDSRIRTAFPSYDGKSIVTVTCDGIIKTWNVFSSQRMSSRDPFPQFGTLNLWSHDGMNLIHSDWLSNTIEILDPVSWKSIETIDTRKGSRITYLALSHNGKLLASASNQGLIEVWDLCTRKRVSTLEGHFEFIHILAWLRDGRLASASSDKTIKIWDTTTCQCLSTFKGHNRGASSLLLSADETQLTSASQQGKIIKIWDLGSSTDAADHNQPVRSVVWSNDAKRFASYSDMEIKVWDPSNAECLLTIKSHSGTIDLISWSQNGNLASLSSDGILRVWDVSTGQCSTSIESVEPSASLTWSQDGSRLTLASHDSLIKTWDARTGQNLCTVKVNKIGHFVTWSHDATRFASVADDWSIMIQDPHTGRCDLHLKGHEDPEFDNVPLFVRQPIIMAWSQSGMQLASALGSTIKIWNLASGQCKLVLEIEQNIADFHFHFSRGASFGEPNPEYLHTRVGSFDTEPYETSATDASASLVCSPRPVGFGLSGCRSWITYNGVNILALPFDYGPNVSIAMAVTGSTVILGCVTGRILILKFSKDLPLM
ncbi:uncharacterized protein N7484_011676 [Penicillium longicatenatum]|uniref:uncharacterized protein n=1 Tax=Penicillium longicatenatum TaxID=1561947 RepID=UPI00254990E0|nr:uncharacterized protein N7484_011676 [Penicillium longicatenatum]KAJ5631576.1 hypothetical protein N7484_011676 [Penicillium longicatenatum]